MATKFITNATTLERAAIPGWSRVAGTAPSPPQLDAGLSSRQNDVLQLMANGLADKEIALALGLSRFTVNKHVSAIIRKLAAGSRTEAAVRAIRAGLID